MWIIVVVVAAVVLFAVVVDGFEVVEEEEEEEEEFELLEFELAPVAGEFWREESPELPRTLPAK